jgi:hypothetical protein
MPLICDDIVFHNVEELEAVSGFAGLRLQRFPQEVRESLGFKHHSRGRFFAHRATGCELRFVTDGKFVGLSMTAMERDAVAIVYRGDWVHSQHVMKAGQITSLFLEDPSEFAKVAPDMLKPRRFAPQVWRITFNQDAILHYHHLETYGHMVRPPHPDETPATIWMAYGSSITYGGNALHAPNAYVQHAARKLKVDVVNKGLPGSCLCEPVVAEYLATDFWDMATLELGVNLAELATPDEFQQRAGALIEQVHGNNESRPVFVLDVYSNRADHSLNPSDLAAQNNPHFREIIQTLVTSKPRPNLHYIPATEVLTDLTGLCADLVHPSDEGHIAMGEELANRIQQVLPLG